MFEFESGVTVKGRDFYVQPGPRLHDFLGARVRRRCLTVWQEHCAECAMPDCYSKCAFYSPRADYKCQRFLGGVSILNHTQEAGAPMAITFGRWARLLGYGPMPLIEPKRAARREKVALRFSNLLNSHPRLRGILAPIRRKLVNWRSTVSPWSSEHCEDLWLVLEAVNEGETEVVLSLTCKVLDVGPAPGTYMSAVLSFAPGYDVKVIRVSRFIPAAYVGKRFAMEIAPAIEGDTPSINFGLIDIVELESEPTLRGASPVPTGEDRSPKIKCVVWDLDNTLWDGVLIEDGLENLCLRPAAVSLIHEFDQKGILQSVVSKNSADDALRALKHFGLSDYFLFPEISWGPKSASLSRIREKLNIGMDTFAYIDDQEFERCEVRAVHSEVLVIDASDIDQVRSNERFNVEVSEESRGRRALYQQEGQRKAALAESAGDYEEFLRSCQIEVTIEGLTRSDLTRASELAQRTNQLNISATRYTADQLRSIAETPDRWAAYVVKAADRFGSYGLVGLCVLQPAARMITDLMFSCRIQSKLVDDAFLAWLATLYGEPLQAKFAATKKNGPAKELLKRNGFVLCDRAESVEIWRQEGPRRELDELKRILSIKAPVT